MAAVERLLILHSHQDGRGALQREIEFVRRFQIRKFLQRTVAGFLDAPANQRRLDPVEEPSDSRWNGERPFQSPKSSHQLTRQSVGRVSSAC